MYPMVDLIHPRIHFSEMYLLIQGNLAQGKYGHLNKTSLFLQVWIKPTKYYVGRNSVIDFSNNHRFL